jgi:hypothetical protein
MNHAQAGGSQRRRKRVILGTTQPSRCRPMLQKTEILVGPTCFLARLSGRSQNTEAPRGVLNRESAGIGAVGAFAGVDACSRAQCAVHPIDGQTESTLARHANHAFCF